MPPDIPPVADVIRKGIFDDDAAFGSTGIQADLGGGRLVRQHAFVYFCGLLGVFVIYYPVHFHYKKKKATMAKEEFHDQTRMHV